IRERSPSYELYFAEFDDQGWPFRSNEVDDAAKQLDFVAKQIALSIQTNKRVSVVTFVHGWKHNATYDDDDVRSFRRLLTGLNHIETVESGCRRHVIGVYVGWRGSSLEVDDSFQDITFCDRKNTAGKVAQGSVRELFARI